MAMNRVKSTDDLIFISRAIVSVSDKRNIGDLVEGLIRINPAIQLYSTGGTFQVIQEKLGSAWGRNLISISSYTGQPEMQGGLVKTLDYRIYMGLLSEPNNVFHEEDMRRTGSVTFDLVVVNLYPFSAIVASEGCTVEDARSHIDIGGPCMLRASAKNFLRVASVCDPDDYKSLIDELDKLKGRLSFATRFSLAQKAFRHTAAYDSAISDYLGSCTSEKARKTYGL